MTEAICLRHLSPGTGRFLQSDPEPGAMGAPLTEINKYIYGGNNPIMNTDPTGKSFLGDALVFVAGFAAAFFAGPLIAAAILGGVTTGAAFYITSAIVGTIIGGLVGGVTNVAIGNGTFQQGALLGGAGGFLGGLAGAAYFGSDMEWRIARGAQFGNGQSVAWNADGGRSWEAFNRTSGQSVYDSAAVHTIGKIMTCEGIGITGMMASGAIAPWSLAIEEGLAKGCEGAFYLLGQ